MIIIPGLGEDRYLGYYTSDWPQQPLVPTTPDEAVAMAARGRAAWIVAIPQTVQIATALTGSADLRLDFGPRVTVHYVRGADMTAAEQAARAVTWAGPDNAIAAQELSEALQAAGDPVAAERVLMETANYATDPRNTSRAETLLGVLLRKQGDSLSALAAYRRAVDSWSGNVEARVRLGEGLLLSGDARTASEELAKAVSQAPDHFWARRFLGQAYLQLDKPRLAAQEFEAAAAIDPAAADTYLLLGDARGPTVTARARPKRIAAFCSWHPTRRWPARRRRVWINLGSIRFLHMAIFLDSSAKRRPDRVMQVRWQLLVVAVLLAGWAARLFRLDSQSLWLDEMGQASVASQGLLDDD